MSISATASDSTHKCISDTIHVIESQEYECRQYQDALHRSIEIDDRNINTMGSINMVQRFLSPIQTVTHH